MRKTIPWTRGERIVRWSVFGGLFALAALTLWFSLREESLANCFYSAIALTPPPSRPWLFKKVLMALFAQRWLPVALAPSPGTMNGPAVWSAVIVST